MIHLACLQATMELYSLNVAVLVEIIHFPITMIFNVNKQWAIDYFLKILFNITNCIGSFHHLHSNSCSRVLCYIFKPGSHYMATLPAEAPNYLLLINIF